MLFDIWLVDLVRQKGNNGLMSTESGPNWVLDWVNFSSAKKCKKGYQCNEWMNESRDECNNNYKPYALWKLSHITTVAFY